MKFWKEWVFLLFSISFSFQLHSEYKSTYKWHEFTPKAQDVATVVKKAPQPNLGKTNFYALCTRIEKCYWRFCFWHADDFLSFSRKKKHPELAYKSHEFFDSKLAPPFPTRSVLNLQDAANIGRVTKYTYNKCYIKYVYLIEVLFYTCKYFNSVFGKWIQSVSIWKMQLRQI